MYKYLKRFGLMVASTAAIVSCSDQQPQKNDVMVFSNGLTPAEKDAKVFTPEVMWKMNRIGASALSSDGKSIVYAVSSYDVANNSSSTTLYLQSVLGGDVLTLVKGNAPQWSSDGESIYFMSNESGDTQLWSMGSKGENPTQVSFVDGGIEAYKVSPKGDNLLYVAPVKVEKRSSAEIYEDMDKSKAMIYDDLMVRHWNYWDEGVFRHLFVAPIADNKAGAGVDIMKGEPWDAPLAPYFDDSEFTWNNSGSQIAYTCKKLTGKEYAVSTDSDIYIYDLASGKSKNINKEFNNATEWVGYEKYPRFSPDDKQILFSSMQRPGNESDKSRIIVMNLADGKSNYLTKDFDYNAQNIMWSSDGQKIYFIAPMLATHQVCSVDMSGKVDVITKGTHDITSLQLGPNSQAGVISMTKLSMASELLSIDMANGKMDQFTDVNSDVYKNIKLGEVKERWVATTDGKKMLTWVVYPPDFDPAKKYPTLLYCQGGPQSVVSQFWSYRWNAELMAAQGYIVVMPNRRGLPSFGQEWLDQISGDYSGQNIQDYLSAIDDVSSEPYVDKDRLGCVGASYGGYSVFFLAGHHEGRFKAFISHCGIFNFDSMYGETEELFFVNNDYKGSYWSDNAVAQRSYANSPHKFVTKWDTPILIFTGRKDYRIPYTQSLQAFTAAKLIGVPSRLVVFEDEGHQVFKGQNSIVWNREFFGWLDKYVKR